MDTVSTNKFAASVKDLNLHRIIAMFIPYNSKALPLWLSSTIAIINISGIACSLFYQGTIWISQEFYLNNMIGTVKNISSFVLLGWRYTSHRYNAATFGDAVTAYRIGITIFRDSDIDYALDQRYMDSNYENLTHGY